MRNVLWLLSMFVFGCAPPPPPDPDDFQSRHGPDDRMAVIGWGLSPYGSYEWPHKGKSTAAVSDDELDVFWDFGEAASRCGVKEYHVREYSDASEIWFPAPKDASQTISCIEQHVYTNFSVRYQNFSEL